MRRKIVHLGLLLAMPLLAAADDITLTTYYPSPRGIYKELRVTHNIYLATIAGNVGIGTLVPGARFVVTGDATNPGNGCPSGYDWYDENQNTFLENGECKRTVLAARADGSVGIGTTTPVGRLDIKGTGATGATYGLAVRNSHDASALAVRDDGTIGFGTSVPPNRLTVTGTPNNPNAFGSCPAGFDWYDENGNGIREAGECKPTGLAVAANGTVGIGTTTPDSRLTINGLGNTNATTALKIFNTNGSPLMSVLDDGSVGIGTTTPLHKFEVVGGSIVSRNSLGGEAYHVGATSAVAPDLAFWTDTLETMRITNDGNVGIGVANPSEKLDVNGRIRVQSPTCDGSLLQPGMVLTAQDMGGGVADGTACWEFPTYQ